jgi:hypothetical protein
VLLGCPAGVLETVVVPDACGVLPAAGAPVLCPADELTGDDGLASGCGVGLAGAELAGVPVALAEVRTIGDFDGAFVTNAVQGLSAAGVGVGVGVSLGLEDGVALDVALPVAFGLAGELGGGVDGVVRVEAADDDTDELVDEAGEAADDGEQDAIGADWRCAADVGADPAPPVRARPPPPGAAELGVFAALWPSSAADTDEVSAWRSGGTEARTAPAANTAQASAIAGLISASRQSLGRRA